MRALLQRVSRAHVEVDEKKVAQINSGWLVFLGVHKSDSEAEVVFLHKKIKSLRGFSDKQGKMNLSLLDTKKEILVVSQFTLCANYQKGNRPSFFEAAPGEKAKDLYEKFCDLFAKDTFKVERGIFAANMNVCLENQGPVTFFIDTSTFNNDK
jgi:D-aminoacyl-tRNA deacylase